MDFVWSSSIEVLSIVINTLKTLGFNVLLQFLYNQTCRKKANWFFFSYHFINYNKKSHNQDLIYFFKLHIIFIMLYSFFQLNHDNFKFLLIKSNWKHLHHAQCCPLLHTGTNSTSPSTSLQTGLSKLSSWSPQNCIPIVRIISQTSLPD